MDTADVNQKEAWPPTLRDLVDLCWELNSRKARYIVIGGMAISYHGFVRATEDIDLLVDASRDNERAIIDAVSQLPDHAARELKPGEIESYQVIRVADEIVVDLMNKACGITKFIVSPHIAAAIGNPSTGRARATGI